LPISHIDRAVLNFLDSLILHSYQLHFCSIV